MQQLMNCNMLFNCIVCQQQAVSVLNQFNTEAMKLSAIGVTLTVSTGDNGVANSGCGCTTNSGSSQSSWTGAGSWTGQGYFPSFPATSPYVTAVGATMGSEDGRPPNVYDQEIACQSQLGGVITSGGGFSTFYAQPSWQTSAVSAYFKGLSVTDTPTSGYNKNGRAIPDLAFLGTYYQVMIADSLTSLFGTSCSSPVTAGMVSLINAARGLLGLTSVGYMNPTLYAASSVSKLMRIFDVF
jgi:tripeptidyl-peptidase-1